MTETWELPLILNQSLKQKFYSASLHQTPSYLSSPHKVNKKDPFYCLKKISNSNYYACKSKTNSLSGTMESKGGVKNCLLKKKKSNKREKRFVTEHEKPQGIIPAAFFELENHLRDYFQLNKTAYTLQQLKELKEIVKKQIIGLKQNVSLCEQKDQVFLDKTVSLLFHSISAEIFLSINQSEALYHLARAEFYALKSKLLIFAVYCLSEQALIQRQKGELDTAFGCLRRALIISVYTQEVEIINGILEKLGIHFYYIGNTAIGAYYHRLAERGLNSKQKELYKTQLSIQKYLQKLEVQLFYTKKTPLLQSKKNLDSTEQCYRIEKQEMERQQHEQQNMVSKMLKDSKLRKIGKRLKSHMGKTLSLASITTHTQSPVIPDSSYQEQPPPLPLINVSHVLKSHLSRNRGVVPSSREWQLQKLIELINNVPQ